MVTGIDPGFNRSRRPHHGLGKPKARAGHVIAVDLNAQPAALEYLGGLAGDVAAGERVQNKLTWLRQKANEEIRQLGRKAGGVA